jgi:hypothetical protein
VSAAVAVAVVVSRRMMGNLEGLAGFEVEVAKRAPEKKRMDDNSKQMPQRVGPKTTVDIYPLCTFPCHIIYFFLLSLFPRYTASLCLVCLSLADSRLSPLHPFRRDQVMEIGAIDPTWGGVPTGLPAL